MKRIVAVLFLLSSCSQQPVKFIPAVSDRADQSVVYIYRQKSFSNAAISPDVLIDGERIAAIKNNSYLQIFLSSGNHNIKLNLTKRYEGKKALDIQVYENNVYYFKVSTAIEFKMNQLYGRYFNIQLIDEALALPEMMSIPPQQKQQAEKNTASTLEPGVAIEKSPYFSIEKTRSPFLK